LLIIYRTAIVALSVNILSLFANDWLIHEDAGL